MPEISLPLQPPTSLGDLSHLCTEAPAPSWPNGSLLRVVRLLSLMWLGYIAVLFAFDTISVTFRTDVPPLPLLYYLLHGLTPLLILGLALSPHVQAHHGRALLRLLMITMAVMPLLVTPLIISEPRPGPLTATPGLIAVRMFPILYVALIVVVWQYHWRQVVLFSLGMAAVGIIPSVITGNNLGSTVTITLLHTIALLALGYCMCLVVERMRAQSRALEQANMQLRHYTSALESLTISRERNRMARELHDTLAHTLSGLTVQLETTKAYLSIDADTARPLLDKALDTARSGLSESRRALTALRASPLDDLGLRLALCEMIRSAAESAQLRLELVFPEQFPTLTPDVEQCVYRVAQEAVANVVQHAGGTSLRVIVSCDNRSLSLIVRDDGWGFDMRSEVTLGHYGLSGMLERAQLVGGSLLVGSEPGQGTTVRFEIGI
jgi:signal transduction histidine kinase